MRELVAFLIFAAFATLAGVSFVTQAAVNAKLRVALASPNWAALASYVGGTITMLVVVALARDPFPGVARLAGAPWWGWAGGTLGAVYVVITLLLLPRLGAATVLALVVLGQMLGSLAFDHVGAFGLQRHPLDLPRAAGAALLVLGVVLIRR